jgi:hypothetical protein
VIALAWAAPLCPSDDENHRDENEQEQHRKDELLPNRFGKL